MTRSSLHLTTDQRLQQRLTPMQVRFGRMLEMTAPEIDEEVRMALDEMPALEKAEPAADSDAPTADAPDGDTFNESAAQLQMADYRNEDDIPHYRFEARNRSADDGERWFDPADGRGETLIESLTEQLLGHDLTPQQRIIAKQIIGNIDDNGYLTRDIRQIAGDLALSDGLDVDAAQVKEVWQTIRTLEPAGVGAIDLRDCLLLQLDRRQPSADPATALAREIVADYFDLMAKKRYDQILSALHATPAALKEAMAVITSLSPKPGNMFAASWMDDSSRHITPDFAVEVNSDEADVDDDNVSLTVSLLNDIPELAIADTFAKDTPIPNASRREAATALAFIRQRREDASNFIHLIKKRQETLRRVMGAIVQTQRKFFITGNEADIKPMILRNIAAITGYDISTISRATASKYVATRHGIFPLKMLFNEATTADSDTSAHLLASRIRAIIDGEDKEHPLSDELITSTLQAEGLDVARRTVAKYREKLGIPVARLRKELKLN